MSSAEVLFDKFTEIQNAPNIQINRDLDSRHLFLVADINANLAPDEQPVVFTPREQQMLSSLMLKSIERPNQKYTASEIKSCLEKPRHVDKRVFNTMMVKVGRTALGDAIESVGYGRKTKYSFNIDRLPDCIKSTLEIKTETQTLDLAEVAELEPEISQTTALTVAEQAPKTPSYKYAYREPEAQSQLRAKAIKLGEVLGQQPKADFSRQTSNRFQKIKSKGDCKGANPDIFYPERGASSNEAKKICMSCSVKEECLEFALETCEEIGIWGGTSEYQRRKIRKERRAQALAEAS